MSDGLIMPKRPRQPYPVSSCSEEEGVRLPYGVPGCGYRLGVTGDQRIAQTRRVVTGDVR